MGGGGGGIFKSTQPETLSTQIRKAEADADSAAFETALSDSLSTLLTRFNDRDVNEINFRLEQLKNCIEDNILGSIDNLFGGSVAKHTYIDGMSDIDSLLIINNSDLYDENPSAILNFLADTIISSINNVTVDTGKIAVTVEYQDGMSIQLLPAVKTDTSLKVLSWSGNRWSNINPELFHNSLTKRNTECNGKLVPTIKLAKAINSNLPENSQLSGYHIEALAIAAFRGYDGPKTITKMLPHFYEKSKDLVLNPITDKSGQSIHVDSYLGTSNSPERLRSSHILNRINKRMMNATAAQSQGQWLSLFGDE